MDNVAAVESPKTKFSDLVREAFIDPIRSVLIIDDQYPTWEQIFSEEGYDSGNGRWASKTDILKVIQQFRKVSPALTVDIHDGTQHEDIGSYLHQSDLLVLDYQLETSEPHGVRATEIIADLLRNNHFNLVIVHTALGDLTSPFNKILMALLTPMVISEDRVAAGFQLVEEFEDSTDIGGNTLEELRAALSATAYVALRAHLNGKGELSDFLIKAPEITAFQAIADKAGWDADARLKVLDWGMSEHDQLVAKHNARLRGLSWSAPSEETIPWIRTNGGFIAFADKTHPELLGILQAAIEDWRPSPSRLMSSRIRADISLQGAEAEDSALSDKHAYWQYYQELRSNPVDRSLQAIKNHRKTLLEGHAARQTERLLDLIGMNAVAFGLRVLEADPTETDATAPGFAEYYAVKSATKEEREKARAHYNAHISTKPVSGWHLHPGHIFRIDREMWVCLSPSCDLVPMQKASAAVCGSKAAEVKPFVAVKLTTKSPYTRSEVNSNTLIFLKEGEVINTYSIYPEGKEFGSPVWRLFMAEDFGKFDIKPDRTADINLNYLSGVGKSMHIEPAKAQIVGQLRYEYALNLIQKLGVEFTRIGLGFSAPPG